MKHAGPFVMLAVLVLFSGCISSLSQTATQTDGSPRTPAQTNPSQTDITDIAQNRETATTVVTISNSSCSPKQEISEYGDVTEYHEIQFTGSAAGPTGTRLEVFLIAGGGVPEENALSCNAWKYSGANSCTSELSEPTLWFFIWKDYSPNTKQYSIRATISLGEGKTLTAYCP